MIAIFPEIISCARDKDIERLAIMTRQYFGGGTARKPVIDVEQLTATAGIKHRRVQLDCRGLVAARDEAGKFEIAVLTNNRLDSIQTKFTLAHLLGHYFLHIQPEIAGADWGTSGFRESICPMERFVTDTHGFDINGKSGSTDQKKEAEADQFACSLLLPRGMLRRAVEQIGDLAKVGHFFGLPEELIKMRWNQLEQSAGLSTADPGIRAHAPDSRARGAQSRGQTGGSRYEHGNSQQPKEIVADSILEAIKAPSSVEAVLKNIGKHQYPSSQGVRGGRNAASKQSSDSKYRDFKKAEITPVGQAGKTMDSKGLSKGGVIKSDTKSPDVSDEDRFRSTKGMARIRELAKLIDKSVD